MFYSITKVITSFSGCELFFFDVFKKNLMIFGFY